MRRSSLLKSRLQFSIIRRSIGFVAIAIVTLLLTLFPTYAQVNSNRDVEALVNFGPRVAGSIAAEQASKYLVNEYRQAGYETEIQEFFYPSFKDLGSTLTIGTQTINGIAYNGSIVGEVNAKLVPIPNFGKPEDFKNVSVQGTIAIVRRGTIPFSDKVDNAANAGAIAVVMVNNQPGNVRGTLTREPKIPVFGISQEDGNTLLTRSQSESLIASLTIKAQKNVLGRNVIAHLSGATQPKLILGGHYDSVPGSPGANDNASGTATVLAIARQLAQDPIAKQIWFIAFDGEEDGLQGSQAFVNKAKPDFLSNLKGMLNFDMVGVNKNLQIDGSSTLAKFSKTAPSIASKPGFRLGSSDHATFRSQNIPTLFFNRGYEPNYHSPNDKVVLKETIEETQRTAIEITRAIAK